MAVCVTWKLARHLGDRVALLISQQAEDIFVAHRLTICRRLHFSLLSLRKKLRRGLSSCAAAALTTTEPAATSQPIAGMLGNWGIGI